MFVTLDQPPQATGWVVTHHRAFTNQCPGAIRLPKLTATREQTEAYYNYLITETPDENTKNVFETRKANALYYFDQGGAMPQPKEKEVRIPKPVSSATSFADSYESVVNVYVQDPQAIISHRSLISRSTDNKLTMRGTTLADVMQNLDNPQTQAKPLLLIRAYDMRKLFKLVISDLVYYAKHHNRPYLLVPDPTNTSIHSHLTQIHKFAELLDALAHTTHAYKIDCIAARRAARDYAQIAAARENFIDYFSLHEATPPYEPPEGTLGALKKYGAFRTDAQDPS
jgi:hypothetical protein